MDLTTEQRKTLTSLIETSTRFDYAEIHDELFDHLASSVSNHLQTGVTFTDAVNLAYNEMGEEEGICSIEKGYIEIIKRQGKVFYRTCVIDYLMSFRWIAAILVAVLLVSISSKLPFSAGSITFIAFLLIHFYGVKFFSQWRLEGEQSSYYKEKKNLKAVTIHDLYIRLIVVLPILAFAPILKEHPALLFVSSSVLFTSIDFTVYFIHRIKQSWIQADLEFA